MYREFNLPPAGKAGDPLVFGWDDETGLLSGPGAEEVRQMADYAKKDGYVVGAPHPTTYDINDPLHRPAELAAVLSQYWVLDDYLGVELQSIAGEDEVFEPGVRH